MTHSHELNFWQKTIALAVWCGAGALFVTVGWEALSPRDPLAAVSLLTSLRAGAGWAQWVQWVQLLLLVATTSAIATIILGRVLPDAGVFAASVVLAALGLRGGTTEYLLLQHADATATARGPLTAQLVVESLAWLAILATSAIISALVSRWFFGADEQTDDVHPPSLCHLSASQLPLIGPWLGGRVQSDVGAPSPLGVGDGRSVRPPRRTSREVHGDAPYRVGLKHTAFVAATMLVLISVMSLDSAHRPILHGQVCFVVAAAAWIATYYGFRYFPGRTALWSLLAVPLVSILAYLWSGIIPVDAGHPANLPPSAMLRPLPIQYIAMGSAGVMAAFWCVRRSVRSTAPAHTPRRRGSRTRPA